jgi:hypothetical protein
MELAEAEQQLVIGQLGTAGDQMGMIVGLQNNVVQRGYWFELADPLLGIPHFGGDSKAAEDDGFEWTMTTKEFGKGSNGLVFGLKHSVFQKDKKITVCGHDPVTGPAFFSCGNTTFVKQFGGDIGAEPGEGFYWYETKGLNFAPESLPRYAVVGLKHSRFQASKTLVINRLRYDPAKALPPPPGFVRRYGGDEGGARGEGFYWYEYNPSAPAQKVVIKELCNRGCKLGEIRSACEKTAAGAIATRFSCVEDRYGCHDWTLVSKAQCLSLVETCNPSTGECDSF